MLEHKLAPEDGDDDTDTQGTEHAELLDRHIEACLNAPAQAPRTPPEIEDLEPAINLLFGFGSQEHAMDDAAAARIRTQEPPRCFDDFELLRPLDGGGQGIVYLARQVQFRRYVAIKFLRPDCLGNPSLRRRFNQEIQAAAKLEHHNIVRVYTAGTVGEWPYLVMEYVRGENLEDLLREKRFSIRGHEWVDKFADLALGLDYAHKQKIIHRDVKPANLIRDGAGDLRLVDFGLAWLQGRTDLHETNARAGSLPYMSPEQVAGRHRSFGSAVDVYGLGATLYQVLTGQPPFTGESEDQLRQCILRDRVKPPRLLNPKVPEQLENIVLKCLAKHPRSRYRSAAALAVHLQRFAKNQEVRVKPPTRLDDLLWHARLSKRGLLELVGTLLILIVTGIALSMRSERLRHERRVERDALVRSASLDLCAKALWSTAGHLGLLSPRWVQVNDPKFAKNFKDPFEGGLQASGTAASSGREVVPVTALVEQSLRTAVDRLDKAIALEGRDADARYFLGRARLLLGDDAGAQDALQEALRLDPTFTQATALLRVAARRGGLGDGPKARSREGASSIQAPEEVIEAWVRVFQAELDQDWNEAARAYTDLERLLDDPKARHASSIAAFVSHDVRLSRGIARLKVGDLTRARADFETVSGIFPDLPEPKLLLASLELREGSHENVEQKLELAFGSAKNDASRDQYALWAAVMYLESAQFEDALRWSRSIPSTNRRLRIEAAIECRRGDAKKAEGLARRAVDLDKDEPAPVRAASMLLLAEILESQGGDAAEVKALLDGVRVLAPGNAEPLVQEASVSLKAGDAEQAKSLLEKAIHLDPKSAYAHALRADILEQEGEASEAERSYRAALAVDPGHGLVRNNLGVLLDRWGRPEDALDEFSRAVLQAPGLDVAHFNYAWALQRQRRFGEAAREYLTAESLGLQKPLPVAWTNLATCVFYLEDFKQTGSLSRQAVTKEPRNAQALHTLGIALEHQGEISAAAGWFENAVRYAPEWVNARNDFGFALARLGRSRDANEQYEAAIRLDKSFSFPWAYNNWASLRWGLRMPIPATDEIRRVLPMLEDASLLQDATRDVPLLADLYRKRISPLLITLASVDALVDGPRELIEDESTWKLRRERSEPLEGIDWAQPGFDDTGWETARGPFTEPDDHRGGTVLTDLRESSDRILLRQVVQVPAPGRIKTALLEARTADEVTLYWNGHEVYHAEAKKVGDGGSDEPPPFWQPEEVALDPTKILGGANVIAVRGSKGTPPRDSYFLGVALKVKEADDEETMSRLEHALQATRAAATDQDIGVAEYLEGRLAVLRGDDTVGEQAFFLSAGMRPDRPEPALQLAALLRRNGRAAQAEVVLRGALERGLGRHERLWHTWLSTCLVDLGWSAESVLENLPAEGALSSNVRWLFETLARGSPVRINCGGKRCRTRDGRVFEADCFARGGVPTYLNGLEEKRDSGALDEPGIYQNVRTFAWNGASVVPGYTIPLPAGAYAVTLHFIEGARAPRRQRVFEVGLEGERQRVELLEKDFGVPRAVNFQRSVVDGFLDIEFVGKVIDSAGKIEAPSIAAIEIARVKKP